MILTNKKERGRFFRFSDRRSYRGCVGFRHIQFINPPDTDQCCDRQHDIVYGSRDQ